MSHSIPGNLGLHSYFFLLTELKVCLVYLFKEPSHRLVDSLYCFLFSILFISTLFLIIFTHFLNLGLVYSYFSNPSPPQILSLYFFWFFLCRHLELSICLLGLLSICPRVFIMLCFHFLNYSSLLFYFFLDVFYSFIIH